MQIAVIGINHNKAPIEIREKAAFTTTHKKEACEDFVSRGITECVILSTCNRSEITIVSESMEEHILYVSDYYQKMVRTMDVSQYLTVNKEKAAVEHIFKVAAGFDSLVLGEDQILGQVKEASDFSMDNGFSGKVLNKLFREAITFSKQLRSEYKISENPLSVSYVGLKLLKQELGSLAGLKVLIIGAGNMGTLALKYMLEESPEKIYLTNRTHQKINGIIEENTGVIPAVYEERYELLKEVDVLITATASPHIVFEGHKIPAREKPLYILDLALPRDVDVEVNKQANIYLYGIDDLNKVIDENLSHRKDIVKVAEKEILLKTEEFIQWRHGLKIDPLIHLIHLKCEKIKNDAMESILSAVDMTSKDAELIEKLLASSLKKNLKKPMVLLKEDHTADHKDYKLILNKLMDHTGA
ncbi:MAG: glutamyl-tRNA reductase [Eubacteriaceae bacterium]|nr:glutamyl-tRNA reductase [Eubacteriaceae bacterium]